jgi:hypothetical protein
MCVFLAAHAHQIQWSGMEQWSTRYFLSSIYTDISFVVPLTFLASTNLRERRMESGEIIKREEVVR